MDGVVAAPPVLPSGEPSHMEGLRRRRIGQSNHTGAGIRHTGTAIRLSPSV